MSLVDMATVVEMEETANGHLPVKPSPDTPSPSPTRPNFFQQIMRIQLIITKIIGMGANDFSCLQVRILYGFYSVCIVVACMVLTYFTYIHTALLALVAGNENIVDQYVWWCINMVWVYSLVTAIGFFVWSLKWNNINAIFAAFNDKRLDRLYVTEDSVLIGRKRRLIAKCYIATCICALDALAWPAVLFGQRGFEPKLLILGFNFVPALLIDLSYSLAFTVYLCTAEMWYLFKYELRKEVQLDQSDKTTLSHFHGLIDRYSDLYDGLTDLSSTVARTFRYYTIIHLLVFLTLLNVFYQSTFDTTVLIGYKIYNWIDIFVQFLPIFAAATVSGYASGLTGVLHMVYRRYHPSHPNTRPEQSQPTAAYFYFYSRLTGQQSLVTLDVAGVIEITRTNVAVFLFTAFNWCAVIMQFRQGSSPSNPHALVNNCTNFTFIT